MSNMEAVAGAPLPAACSPRHMVPTTELPSSIQRILKDECRDLVQDKEVPPIITNNPLWLRISPLPKDLYVLYDRETVSALLVVLRDSGLQLVIKTLCAERATDALLQVQAELDAAKSFTWHPLMTTLVAACYDKDGNFCSIMPYAGCNMNYIIHYPDWFTTVSDKERLDFVRQTIQHGMMVFDIMQHTGDGHYYRDVKPDNLCVSPTTGLVSVIDYGLKVWANMENFHLGDSPGYVPPEFVKPAPDGFFETFFCEEEHKKAITNTFDAFLISYVGLEAAVGLLDLPWELQPWKHDIETIPGFIELLSQHSKAAAAGYEDLIARVPCTVARDFFRRTMCSDPAVRLTPAQALKHEWLAGKQAEVQQMVAAATPAYQQQNQQLADIFAGVPGVMQPQPQLQQQQRTISPALSVSSAVSLDVPQSPTTSSCSQRSSSPSTSSNDSGDTAVGDQLPAASLIAADAAAKKKKPSLLQRGKKLLSKLARSKSDKKVSAEDSSLPSIAAAASHAEAAVAVVTVQGRVGKESCAVSVPGLCGLKWFRKSSRHS